MSLLALILSILLAGAYLGAGTLKIVTPRDKLLDNPRMGWAGDYSARSVKGIGLAEVLGAVGLLVPWYTGILPFLTPVAALLLGVLQVLAARVHLRRGESNVVGVNVVLALLALVLAVLRFVQLGTG